MKRLGLLGAADVKKHAWFKGLDWELLKQKKVPAHYSPKRDHDNFDKNYVNNPEWKDGQVVEQTAEQLERQSVQYQFRGYYYDRDRVRRTTPFISGFTSMMMDTAAKQAIHDDADEDDNLFNTSSKNVDDLIKKLSKEMDADGEDNKVI